MITKKQEPCTRCDDSEKEFYCSYCERCNDCCPDWEKHGRMGMAEKGHAISFDRTWDAIKKDDWYESPGRDDEIDMNQIANMPKYFIDKLGLDNVEQLDQHFDDNKEMMRECVDLFLGTLAPMFENSDQDSYVAEAASHRMGRTPSQSELYAARDEAARLLENFVYSVREQID